MKVQLYRLIKAGPFIGPRGGKWADSRHTIPWTEQHQKRGGVRTGVVKIDEKRVRETVDMLFNGYGKVDENGYRKLKGTQRLQIRGDLRVEMKHDPHARPGNLGNLRFEGGGSRAVITLFVGDYVYGKDEVTVKQRLRRVLAHEVTHHSDPSMRSGKLARTVRGETESAERDLGLPSGPGVSEEQKHHAYLNLKHEVTARLQEVHRDLIHPLVKRDYLALEKEHGVPSGENLLWFARKNSPVFKDVFEKYEPSNQKRMMRMIASTLGGLRTGAIEPVVKSYLMVKAAHKLQGRRKWNGLDVSIENRVGSVRRWTDESTGEEGQTKMQIPYGYVRGSIGRDGDHVDVFVGPNEQASHVYVVDQLKAPEFKQLDEQKCMLGFDTAEEAKRAYLRHYDDKRFFGSIKAMPLDEFKRKVLGTTVRQPLVRSFRMVG